MKTGVTYSEKSVHSTEDAKLAAPNAKALVVKDGSHEDDAAAMMLVSLDGPHATKPARLCCCCTHEARRLYKSGGELESWQMLSPRSSGIAAAHLCYDHPRTRHLRAAGGGRRQAGTKREELGDWTEVYSPAPSTETAPRARPAQTTSTTTTGTANKPSNARDGYKR